MPGTDPSTPSLAAPPPRGSRVWCWVAVLTIVLAGLAAYRNSLHGPFVYLDQAAIRDNPTIRHLWPLSTVLQPPRDRGITVEGRPLVNLTFALNYAAGGGAVRGYHLANLAIHLAGGLLLFGIIRRTLTARGDAQAVLFAWIAALLWVVHPLTTESVTYLVQRAESLMGLFYLATLYGFIRGAGSSGAGRAGWFGLSWLACLLGMATKEVMVSAPLIVFCYDRTFSAGAFVAAWRRRRGYYLALAATWLALGYFVATTGGNRGGTSGFGLGISLWSYLLTQCWALVHYLRLSVWPAPLTFYYEVIWFHVADVWLQGVVVVALLIATAVALWRRPVWGFLGLWFFAILSPTSLIPGMSQTVAEHRMYLPLIAVIILGVAGARWLAARARAPAVGWASPLVLLALVYLVLTTDRNATYASESGLWADTVAKAPGNPFSHNNLGIALNLEGRHDEAAGQFRKAVDLDPAYASALDNLGLSLAESGRPQEAIPFYLKVLESNPNLGNVRLNLGVALMNIGQVHEAARQFTRVVGLDPKNSIAYNDLANAETILGHFSDAITHYRAALRLSPDSAETWYNLGNSLTKTNEWAGAVDAYRRAIALRPAYPEAAANLGASLASLGQLPEAVAAYQQALRLVPEDADVHENLGRALQALGHNADGERELATAARLRRLHPGS